MIPLKDIQVLILLRNILSILIVLVGTMWLWATKSTHWFKDYAEPSLVVLGSLIAFCQFLITRWTINTQVPYDAKLYNISNTHENQERLKKAKESIAKAQTEFALTFLSGINTPFVIEQVTLLSARFAKLRQISIEGISSSNEETAAFIRLNRDILRLVTTLEEVLSNTSKFEEDIRNYLKRRYTERLRQKLANRQPINLRKLPTIEGTSKEISETFVTISEEKVKEHIINIFHTSFGRLLITGKPGAGKTTLLLQLEIALLESETDDLPVLLNLATWKKEFITLESWLKEVLPAELGTSKQYAIEILQQKRLVLLFDGLDEVNEDDRKSCLEVLGRYRETTNCQYVITSRIEEYKNVLKDAPVNLQIEVGDLTLEQLVTELERLGHTQAEALPLLKAIQKNELLKEAARTPFYFNTLQLLFAGGKTLSDLNLKGTTIDEVKDEITSCFVVYEFATISADKRYLTKDAQRYLSFLAFRLATKNKVVFELADVQYHWYPFDFSRMQLFVSNFIYFLINNLMANLFFGIISGFVINLIFIFIGYFVLIIAGIITGFFLKEKHYEISTKDGFKWSWPTYFEVSNTHFLSGILFSLSISFINSYNKDSIFWLYSGLLGGVLIGFIEGFFDYLKNNSTSIIQINSPYQRFNASMKLGHFSILQHWHLMYILDSRNLLPIKIVPFLNDMVKHKILESDGATWRFRHRILQDFFHELGNFERSSYDFCVKGDLYSEKNNWNRAIEYYQKAVEIKPDYLRAFYQLGDTYFQKNNWDNAIKCYQKAVEIEPSFYIGLSRAGDAYSEKNDWDKAIECYQKAIEIEPNWYMAFRGMGNTYSEKNDWDKAIECYQKAIEIKPDDYWAFYKMGNIYFEKNDWDNAIECYQKAIEIEPDDYWAFYKMGNIYFEKNDWDKAIECYQKVVENEAYYWIFCEMGDTYSRKEDWDKAIECYQKAIEIEPDDYWAFYKMGEVYFEQNEWDNAIKCYQKAVDIEPDDCHEALHSMGASYSKKGDLDKAIEFYQMAVKIKPDYHQSFYQMGSIYSSKGDFDNAIDNYKKAIEIKLESNSISIKIIILLYKNNYKENAIEFCLKVIESRREEINQLNEIIKIEANEYGALIIIGIALATKKDFNKSIECLKEAIQLRPFDQGAYLFLGLVLLQTGDIEKSEIAFQKTIDFGSLKYGNLFMGHIYLRKRNRETALYYYSQSLTQFKDKQSFWTALENSLDFESLQQYKIDEDFYKEVYEELKKEHS